MMAAQPNIGGALCESSVIRFLVPRHKVWLTPVQWRCQYRRTQELDANWSLHVAEVHQKSKAAENVYIVQQPRRRPNIVQSLVDLSGERNRCSNEAKTWNPLKFAGVPQTHEPISAISGTKFAILWGHVEAILLFNKFFLIVNTHLSCKNTAGRSCAMVNFWQFFWVPYFQRAACSTLHTAF